MSKNDTGDNQMRLYRDLAWTWPLIISPPEEYVEEGGFFTEKIRQYERLKTRTLLDLGCGGGHMDWVMKKDFAITGIDINEPILMEARKLNPEVEYEVGDMRAVRLGKTFDAVMIHDAIAYMQTPEELQAAFLTAYEHLKPNGLVITYCEEWPGHFMQNRSKLRTGSKGKIDYAVLENYYDLDPSDNTYELTFIYLIRREGHLDIQTDRHILGMFPPDEWRRIIRDIGYELIEDKFTHSEFPEDEYYPMFLGIRNE
ncbi:MAG: methyltransferase domain-containing protein [Candidatus Zixiibacteriota bacterium]|nr:MAG: methyltransferase domain-containing protein [candidate division Zixibacteria bacterium]